jgi:hypothetical protein
MIKQFIATSIQGLLTCLQAENPTNFRQTGSMQRILLDHLIRWYAQVNDSEQDVYGLYMTDWVAHAEVSCLAANALREVCQTQVGLGTRSTRQKALKQVVHFEHNAPVRVKREEMLLLLQNESIQIEDIQNILATGYRIEVLSQTELAHLNASQLRANGTAAERTARLSDTFYTYEHMYLSSDERVALKHDLTLFLNG